MAKRYKLCRGKAWRDLKRNKTIAYYDPWGEDPNFIVTDDDPNFKGQEERVELIDDSPKKTDAKAIDAAAKNRAMELKTAAKGETSAPSIEKK